jgi:capsular polysaccharide biosynthesis protein
LDGPSDEWQEGPSLAQSVRRYRWLVVAAVLVGAIAAYGWSSRQPVRYEGVVKVYLDAGGDRADPGRIVRSQAQYLTSTEVLNRTVELIDGRLTRKELSTRLTVEPARDADLITIRALDATPEQAAALADTVVRAYREVVAKQTAAAVAQQVLAINKRQQRLNTEITSLKQQRNAQPGNQVLTARINAKNRELDQLADQAEAATRTADRATSRVDTLRDNAALPDERAQPKPLRTAAIGALLALVVAAGLAWWLNGRRTAPGRARPGLLYTYPEPTRHLAIAYRVW